MDSILFWIGALIVFSVLSPLIKYAIAAVAGKQIGAKALAQQPDRIHLQPCGTDKWKNAAAARRRLRHLPWRRPPPPLQAAPPPGRRPHPITTSLFLERPSPIRVPPRSA